MNEPEKCPVTKKHRQSVVWSPTGERILVDRGLAPLIDGLQRLGIQTFSSCEASCGGACRRKHRLVKVTYSWETWRGKRQRTPCYHYSKPKRCKESCWLVFASMQDARRFLNVVSRPHDSEELRDSMQGIGVRDSDAWTWKATVEDVNDRRCIDHRGYWIGKPAGPPSYDFYCHLVLPRKHLELVTERVLQRCTKQGR